MNKKKIQAYPKEILKACQNGIPCDYGICDECPNTIGTTKDSDSDE